MRAGSACSSTSSSTTCPRRIAAFRRAQARPRRPRGRAGSGSPIGPTSTTRSSASATTRASTATTPAPARHMIEAARLWLDVGVDGFRCDYANGPSHAFWSAFRAATRAARPDSVTLGEVVETPALQRTLRRPARRLPRLPADAGASPVLRLPATSTAGELDAFLRRHLAFFGDGLALPSFLDNHDMNRFLWVVGGDTRRLRLAAMCQFALPGPPIVYYGTELGLSQRRDVRYADGSGHPEESRLPMPWDDADASLLAFYVELGRLRRATAGLWRAAARGRRPRRRGRPVRLALRRRVPPAPWSRSTTGTARWRSRWTRRRAGASPCPRPTASAWPPAGWSCRRSPGRSSSGARCRSPRPARVESRRDDRRPAPDGPRHRGDRPDRRDRQARDGARQPPRHRRVPSRIAATRGRSASRRTTTPASTGRRDGTAGRSTDETGDPPVEMERLRVDVRRARH